MILDFGLGFVARPLFGPPSRCPMVRAERGRDQREGVPGCSTHAVVARRHDLPEPPPLLLFLHEGTCDLFQAGAHAAR